MAGQKIENLLNLALDTTQEEREKSLELDVGYDPIEREWDVIVKYSGSLDNIRALASGVTELLNEYAIVTVKESRLAGLAALTEVEYIEKPKRLFFQTADARRVSCIDTVQDTRLSLFGQGTSRRRPGRTGGRAPRRGMPWEQSMPGSRSTRP